MDADGTLSVTVGCNLKESQSADLYVGDVDGRRESVDEQVAVLAWLAFLARMLKACSPCSSPLADLWLRKLRRIL